MPTAGARRLPPERRSEKGVRALFPGKRALTPFSRRTPFAPRAAVLSIVGLGALALWGDGLAQEAEPGAGQCTVITGTPDLNAEGEFVRPPATPEACAAAEALVEQFLAMSRGDFRRVDLIEGIPGNVSVYVGRLRPWGGSVEQLPVNRRHGVTWLSDRIVVVVIESSDFAGPTTTVVIADLETHQVCEFTPWPGGEDPRKFTVAEIQDVLDRGLSGRIAAPACRLAPLPID